MEKYISLEATFLKRHFYPHLILVFLFCVLSGGFVSFRNLEQTQAAKVMEMYVILTGIMLLTPIFVPEQDRDIRELERSKALPLWKVFLQRTVTAVMIELLVITAFAHILSTQSIGLDVWLLWRGGVSEALFLGSIGYFVSAVTNQVILGYMISILYYAANIGMSGKFGVFGLFKMMRGQEVASIWMVGASLALGCGGVAIRNYLAKK